MYVWTAEGLGQQRLTRVRIIPRESGRFARWGYWKLGLRTPQQGPEVNWGNDGPIPVKYRKAVQFAHDVAYHVNLANVRTWLPFFKRTATRVPEIDDLTVDKIRDALNNMVIHLADTSEDPIIRKEVQDDESLPLELQIPGLTKQGKHDVYIREFAIKQGIDALANAIFHESLHVAGIHPGVLEVLEPFLHGFEANVGLPPMAGGGEIKPIPPQPQGFSGLNIEYRLWKIGGTENLPADLALQILDDDRRVIFEKKIRNRPGSYIAKWNGRDKRTGKLVSWGLYTVRIVSPNLLHASVLLEVSR
jgi:hypothetical protein